MEIEVGAVLEGKVTGITKFGAFVALPGGKSGMVHISEVASTFVKEISDFVTMDQEVKVKVIGIDQSGRISLSMKQAAEPTEREPRPMRPMRPMRQPRQRTVFDPSKNPAEFDWGKHDNTDGDLSFEDKMTNFKKQSDDRMLDWKRAMDGRRDRKKSRN